MHIPWIPEFAEQLSLIKIKEVGWFCEEPLWLRAELIIIIIIMNIIILSYLL